MSKRRFLPATIFALILIFASSALAGDPLSITGQVVDNLGNPLGGLTVSDEFAVAQSGADGKFSLKTESGRIVWFAAPDGYAMPDKWWMTAGEAAKAPHQIKLEQSEIKLPVRIALIADPHLFDYATLPDYYKIDEQASEKPLRAWEDMARKVKYSHPRLTIILGDLCNEVDKGSEERAESQMKLGAQAAALLPKPWRAIPGNHDVRYDQGEVDYSLWRKYMGPMRHIYKTAGVAFIMLDNVTLGQRPGGKPKNCGGMSESSLQWLQDILATLPPEMPVILCTHFPLASAVTGANPLHKSSLVVAETPPGFALRDVDQNAAKAFEMLMERNICALVSGHEHAFHHGWLNPAKGPLQLVAAPALCGAWWSGNRQWGPMQFNQGWLEAEIIKSGKGVEVKPFLQPLNPPVNVREN